MVRTINHARLAAGGCIVLVAASCGRPPGHAVPTSPHRLVAPGLTFTIRMAGTSFTGRPLEGLAISAQFLDGVLRVDLPRPTNSSVRRRAAPEFYLLVNMTEKVTTVVTPADKRYWETSFDPATARGARSTTVMSDIDVSGTAAGSGGTINGYATKRYRITSRYTETPLAARKAEARKTVHVVEDVWVTDALKDVSDPMQAYLRLLSSSGTLRDLVEKQVEARRRLFKGLPIRTTWLYTQTFDGGGEASRTLTIDILDLKRTDLDPAAFRVPDGYGRLDVQAMFKAATDLLLRGAQGALNDSATGRRKP